MNTEELFKYIDERTGLIEKEYYSHEDSLSRLDSRLDTFDNVRWFSYELSGAIYQRNRKKYKEFIDMIDGYLALCNSHLSAYIYTGPIRSIWVNLSMIKFTVQDMESVFFSL